MDISAHEFKIVEIFWLTVTAVCVVAAVALVMAAVREHVRGERK